MNKYLINDCIKRAFPENFDTDFYIEVLKHNPEKRWFYPDNSKEENYSVCRELAAMGVIAERKTPQWNNGLFRGFRHEFYYDLNMLFTFEIGETLTRTK